MLTELKRNTENDALILDPVAAAAEMIPLLRASAPETDRLAKLPDSIVDALEHRGLFRLLYPADQGGAQIGPHAFMDTMVNIGRGDMSAAWALAILNGCTALVARTMPKHVSDVVYATEGGAKISAVFSARSLKARPENGGVHIEEGLWAFNSGVQHANWDLLGVPIYDKDGNVVDEGLALIPMSKVEILNDWDTMALRGTGSNTVRVRDVFVEADWILPFGKFRRENFTQPHYADQWQFRTTATAEGSVHLAYSGLGAAQAALEVFQESLGKGGIQYTQYTKKSEAPVIHIAIAEASARIDAARTLACRAVDEIEAAARSGEIIDPMHSARIRRDTGLMVSLLWEGVDRLASVSGGSFLGSHNLLSRCWRDIRAGTMHGAITPATVMESYGRMLCGLGSNMTMAGLK